MQLADIARILGFLVSYGVIPLSAIAVDSRELYKENSPPIAMTISLALIAQALCQEGQQSNRAIQQAIDNSREIVQFAKQQITDIPRIPGNVVVVFCAGGELLLTQQALQSATNRVVSLIGAHATAGSYFVLEWEEAADIVESATRKLWSRICRCYPQPPIDNHDLAHLEANLHLTEKLSYDINALSRFNSFFGSVGYHFMKAIAVYRFLNKGSAGLVFGSLIWVLNLIVSQGLGAKRTGMALQHLKKTMQGFIKAPDKEKFIKEGFSSFKKNYHDWPKWLIFISLAVPMILAPAGAYSWGIVNQHGVEQLFSFLEKKIQIQNGGHLTSIQRFFLRGSFVSSMATFATLSGMVMHFTREGLTLAHGVHQTCANWYGFQRIRNLQKKNHQQPIQVKVTTQEDDEITIITILRDGAIDEDTKAEVNVIKNKSWGSTSIIQDYFTPKPSC